MTEAKFSFDLPGEDIAPAAKPEVTQGSSLTVAPSMRDPLPGYAVFWASSSPDYGALQQQALQQQAMAANYLNYLGGPNVEPGLLGGLLGGLGNFVSGK